MPDKTKATLQGRHCHKPIKSTPEQTTTIIMMVNTEEGFPASFTGIPVSLGHTAQSGEDLWISSADAQPKHPIIWVVHDRLSFSESVPDFYPVEGYDPSSIGGLDTHNLGIELQVTRDYLRVAESHAQTPDVAPGHFLSSRFNTLWQTEVSWSFRYLLHVAGGVVMNLTPRKTTAMMMIRYINLRIDYPFGSIPRCASSLRIMRLIQAETVASPSSDIALRISFSSSSSTRNAICLLPLPLIEMVDTWLTPFYSSSCLKCMTSVNQIATPRTARTVPGRLTKPLSEVTTMAKTHSTQTRSKFTWRFLAVGASTPDTRPIILYTTAPTEEEARDNCPGWILYFAARLPLHVPEVVGVQHV